MCVISGFDSRENEQIQIRREIKKVLMRRLGLYWAYMGGLLTVGEKHFLSVFQNKISFNFVLKHEKQLYFNISG